jgi:hypothetical protein
MTKFITTIVLAATVLAGVSAAQAAPMFGNALREAAQAGSITPHGVFDAR